MFVFPTRFNVAGCHVIVREINQLLLFCWHHARHQTETRFANLARVNSKAIKTPGYNTVPNFLQQELCRNIGWSKSRIKHIVPVWKVCREDRISRAWSTNDAPLQLFQSSPTYFYLPLEVFLSATWSILSATRSIFYLPQEVFFICH